MIIIPMAGLSSRFFKAGYTVPKYMLNLNEVTVFSWAISSFQQYFTTDHFLFICREDYQTESFIRAEIEKLGILSYKIIVLKFNTLGQADTVYKGIKDIENDDEIYIFNIDSRLNNFKKLENLQHIDGYLEVFKGEGEHWSFVLPGENDTVLRTTEKQRISDLCSNGLYYFHSLIEYKRYFEKLLNSKFDNELYIAPMYNDYIQDGKNIQYKLVEIYNIDFCGTPQEFLKTLAHLKGDI